MDTLLLEGTTSVVCCLTSSDGPEEGWESGRESERGREEERGRGRVKGGRKKEGWRGDTR